MIGTPLVRGLNFGGRNSYVTDLIQILKFDGTLWASTYFLGAHQVDLSEALNGTKLMNIWPRPFITKIQFILPREIAFNLLFKFNILAHIFYRYFVCLGVLLAIVVYA